MLSDEEKMRMYREKGTERLRDFEYENIKKQLEKDYWTFTVRHNRGGRIVLKRKKIITRICAALMVVTMGVSMVSGTKVLAAEELLTAPSVDSSDEIAQQNEIEDKADAVTEENSDDSVLERENISADGVAEEVEESVNDSTKPLIQYLYVEKPNLSVGEKQKIVVSVAENTEVNGVSLIYQKEETSEILETCSVNEADGANEFDIYFQMNQIWEHIIFKE